MKFKIAISMELLVFTILMTSLS